MENNEISRQSKRERKQKRYKNSAIGTKEWLECLNIKEFTIKIYDDQMGSKK